MKPLNTRGYDRRVLPTVVAAVSCIAVGSCDITDFGDMNENPTQSTEMDDRFLITTIQLGYAGGWIEADRHNLGYSSGIVQHVARRYEHYSETYSLSMDAATRLWNANYAQNWLGVVKHVQDVIHRLELRQGEGETVSNRLAVARILRAFNFQRLTDVYGDLPYFEGGKGSLDRNFTPRFDPQQEIYSDMLRELKEAVEEFDPGQDTYGISDLVYQGDIGKWQRFANSLRLRLALRLAKVAPELAAAEAVAALNAPGGVMQSADDMYLLPHESGPGLIHHNPIGEHRTQFGTLSLSQTLVDWLKERGDPRLMIYGAVVKDDDVTTDAEQQLGWPNGYNSTTIESHSSWTGDESDYTVMHPRFGDIEAPTVWFTYAEVEFMLAEAAVRGWIASDAEAHYNSGVRAAMNYLSVYSGDTNVSAAEIDDYLARNPFDGTLEQINEQYWAAVFLNGYEAWANWKRTGYPELEPSPVDDPEPHPASDTGGEIPRRLVYGEAERILNAANYQDAVDRQGPDNLLTRVWWDVDGFD